MARYSDDILNLYRGVDEGKIKSAKNLSPHSIADDGISAHFASSSTGELYNTTLSGCTCPDHRYRNRGRACKHMLYLALRCGIPITYQRLVPKQFYYGTDEPTDLEQPVSAAEPVARDYPLDEFLSVLSNLDIATDDKRSAGGCLWVENTRKYETFLSRVTVDGKPLVRTKPSSRFKWQFAWYLK